MCFLSRLAYWLDWTILLHGHIQIALLTILFFSLVRFHRKERVLGHDLSAESSNLWFFLWVIYNKLLTFLVTKFITDMHRDASLLAHFCQYALKFSFLSQWFTLRLELTHFVLYSECVRCNIHKVEQSKYTYCYYKRNMRLLDSFFGTSG